MLQWIPMCSDVFQCVPIYSQSRYTSNMLYTSHSHSHSHSHCHSYIYMSNILEDPFLVKQNIIASPSQFLADEYQKEIKFVDNPRDMYGSKMSTDWGTGDQAYTVGIRRVIDRLDLLLDPDTYTMKSMLQLKKSLETQQVAILTLIVTTANVYAYYRYFLRNQIAAVRRLYTMDKHKFYDFLAKNLNIKNKMKTKKEVEQELFK